MRVLGLDESLTSFGWVVYDTEFAGFIVDKGLLETDPKTGLTIQRLMLQRDRVKALIVEYDIKYVGIEAPIFNSYSSEILYALNLFLHEVFLKKNIKVVEFTPSTLKALAIPEKPSTEVFKSDMVSKMKSETGITTRVKNDIADAYFAAKFGLMWWEFHEGTTAFEELPEHVKFAFKREKTITRGKRKGFVETNGIYYRKWKRFFLYGQKKSIKM